MRALLTSLVMLAFAVTGTANCALAQSGAGAGEADAQAHAYAHLPPCHWPAGFDPEAGQPAEATDEAACQGGAACVDCALGIGLTADMVPVAGTALHGAPRLFAVKTALSLAPAHDPPPPRA
ncbi:MAG: hypothetical protein JJU26_03630 [Oceanicaulis sp.]|uniref:hypothetical protein n=1 Tax=Glycocaulis sp. TaxID=1969725 RepID=UPI0025BF1A7A|nr:hypothetical protein [Glycocaulis sp.]MCC5980792.1 hypothetical protein [Oceanicaulis sp.]MCH8521036.1 hypothetical protein [Glycocaulis sp.]